MGWEWKDEGNGWKTKQRRTRKPRGERAAARTQQSASTRSQLSSSTPSTSSEREREVSWKLKPPRSSTTCSTPSCTKALCSTTGLARSPTAVTVVRLLPRLQLRSIRSRSGPYFYPARDGGWPQKQILTAPTSFLWYRNAHTGVRTNHRHSEGTSGSARSLHHKVFASRWKGRPEPCTSVPPRTAVGTSESTGELNLSAQQKHIHPVSMPRDLEL